MVSNHLKCPYKKKTSQVKEKTFFFVFQLRGVLDNTHPQNTDYEGPPDTHFLFVIMCVRALVSACDRGRFPSGRDSQRERDNAGCQRYSLDIRFTPLTKHERRQDSPASKNKGRANKRSPIIVALHIM